MWTSRCHWLDCSASPTGQSRSEGIIIDRMQRQPMPGFWIAVQIAIVICVLISAVIVIVKL